MDDLKENGQGCIDDFKDNMEENIDKIQDKLCHRRSRNKKELAPSLGVIRLDYDYPPAPGDIDSPDSFPYKVYYKVVPGLSFEMCQSGNLTEEVKDRFKESIQWLVNEKNVSGITGDCGFMMYF